MAIYSKWKGHKNNKQLEKDMWPGTNYTEKNRKLTLAQINENRDNKPDCWCANPDYCNQYCWGSGNGFNHSKCVGCGFLIKPEEESE